MRVRGVLATRVAAAAWVSLALVWPAVLALVWGGSPAGAAVVAAMVVAAAALVGPAGSPEAGPVRVAGVVARAAVPLAVRQRDPDTAGRPRPRAPGRGAARLTGAAGT
jgi:Family of unknown function (DUF6412)